MENSSELGFYGSGRFNCITDLIPSSGLKNEYCLDIGCGIGVWNSKMRDLLETKGYNYVGINIAKEQLLVDTQLIGPKKRDEDALVLADACNLPFKHRFKMVIALEVIEHLSNPQKMLFEIKNALTDNGSLLISTPNSFSADAFMGKARSILTGKQWCAWDPSHRHIYDSIEFIALLKNFFEIKKVYGYHAFPHVAPIQKINSYSKVKQAPFNKLCFQVIVLLTKK